MDSQEFVKISDHLESLFIKINAVFIKSQIHIPQDLEKYLKVEEEGSSGDTCHSVPCRGVRSLYCLVNFKHFKSLVNSLLVHEKELCIEINDLHQAVERFKQNLQLCHLLQLDLHQERCSCNHQAAVRLKLRKFWAKTSLVNLQKLLMEINLSFLASTSYMFIEVGSSDSGCIVIKWMVSNVDAASNQLSLQPISFMKTIGVVSLDIGETQVYANSNGGASISPLDDSSPDRSINAALIFIMELIKDERAMKLLIQTKCIHEIKLFSRNNVTSTQVQEEVTDSPLGPEAVLISNHLDHFIEVTKTDLNSLKDLVYGGNLLHWAMFWGWVELAMVLISMYSLEPLCPDNTSRIPLVYACWNDQLDAVRYLIEQCNCDSNYVNDKGMTLLHTASRYGNIAVVQYLITECGHDPMCTNNIGLTSLHFACSTGQYYLLKYFIEELKCNAAACKTNQGFTLLHYACSIGQQNIVQYLVNDCGCDPTCTATNGGTPLHEASNNGKLDTVKYLITDCKCNPMCQTNDGFTPLHYACYNGQLDVVQYLITKCNCNPICKSNNGITPLYNSCSKNGKLEVVKYLIKECGCNAHHSTNGSSLLTYASSNGQLEIVQYLIKECGCDPMDRGKKGLTLLHYACSIGRLDIVQYLVNDCGCDPTCTATNGGTPLHEASNNGKLDTVKYLITDCKCNPMCQTNDGFTPLHYACYNGQLDVVQYLITKCNCNPICKSNNGITPLYNSCSKNGKLEVVKYLIKECKCDPNYKMRGGFTPLHYACCNGLLNIVKFLIQECECDPACIDDNSRTPLHEACCYGNLDVIRYLIVECGHDPMCTSSKGETPLHEAADTGNLDAVKYLVTECKCDPMFKAKSGLTSLHLACSAGKLDVVRYLVTECMCDPSIVTQFRMSSLFLAAFYNHFDVVAFLVSSGYHLASYEIGILTSEPRIKGLLRLALKCYAVNSFVNIFLLGDSGVGKSTLTEVIKQRVNGGKVLFGHFRSVSNVEPLTAGIVPHVLKHKELGNIILHDFAGQPQYYSSHSAILEDMLSGSPAVFILVTKLFDPTPYKWLSIINDLRSKCSGECVLFTIASHADLVQSKMARLSQVKNLDHEIKSCIVNSNHETYFLNCRKRVSEQLNLFLGSLLKSCQSLRSSMQVTPQELTNVHTAEYKIHMSMLFLLLKSERKEVLSFDELTNLVQTNDSYCLPDTTSGIIKTLQYLHKIGLIFFICSTRGSWIVFNKESLLKKIIGTLLAPAEDHQSLSNSTGIVCEDQLAQSFVDYDPMMIVEFLILMQLCERISSEMLDCTNLFPLQIYEGQQKLLFIPALLTIREKPSCSKLKFQFGWCLQEVEKHRYFTSRFLHVLILRLAYKYALVKTSDNPHSRRCTVWSTGIMLKNGDGITTLVELVNNDQSLVVLMACQEGLQHNLVPVRRAMITDILSVQQDHCASLHPREFVIDPSQLNNDHITAEDPLSTLVLYDINSIAFSVSHRKPCVVSYTEPYEEILLNKLFPKEYERGADMSVFINRDLQMLEVSSIGHNLIQGTIITSPIDALKKYSAQLVDFIRDPERLANNLFSKDLISMRVKDDIVTTIGVSTYSRASRIMNDVYREMSSGNEIEKFKKFCDVLKLDSTDAMRNIILKMENEVGCTE